MITDRLISKSEFKSKALQLFREIEATGQSLILTDHGKPTLEIRRYHKDANSPIDILRGSVISYEGATEPILVDDWEVM